MVRVLSESSYRLTPEEGRTAYKYSKVGLSPNSAVILEIFTEGDSDVQFYKNWIDKSKIEKNRKISIKVEGIRKNNFISGARGNRESVLQAANATKDDLYTIYIADRDLWGEGDISEYSSIKTLFFTDFPAVESYAFLSEVLDELNIRKFDNCYGSLEGCHKDISKLLKVLYVVRSVGGERLWNQVYGAMSKLILEKTKLGNLSQEDYQYIVDKIFEIIDGLEIGYDSPDFYPRDDEDPREYAYGHDIAKIIKCLMEYDASKFKKLYPKYSVTQIENAITNIYISMKLYERDELFKSISKYVDNLLLGR